jgi:hypothetical protein
MQKKRLLFWHYSLLMSELNLYGQIRRIGLILLLSFSLAAFSQNDSKELSAEEQSDKSQTSIKSKISDLDKKIDLKQEELSEAKTAGNTALVEKLSSELKALKGERRMLKEKKRGVVIVGMPIVGKNANMGFFAGLAGTLVYNLDKNMKSPFSVTSVYFNKSVENSGLSYGITNKQYLSENKWRFSQQYLHYKYEMPISVTNIGELDMYGKIDMLLLKGWRRIGNSKWYGGLKVEYNKSSVEYSHSALASMNGETTMYSPGIVLDYDGRDKPTYPTKGFFLNTNFTYMSHALGFKSSDPGTGVENEDPVAYYLITKFQYFHSPVKSWRRVFSHQINTTLKMGDIGSAQYVSNTSDQRSFNKATLQGPISISYNTEYDHFFNESKLGFAVFGSLNYVCENEGNDDMNGFAAGLGGGIRYMAKPKAGIVLRADYGAGFTFKSGQDTQGQFSMGIGKFF